MMRKQASCNIPPKVVDDHSAASSHLASLHQPQEPTHCTHLARTGDACEEGGSGRQQPRHGACARRGTPRPREGAQRRLGAGCGMLLH